MTGVAPTRVARTTPGRPGMTTAWSPVDRAIGLGIAVCALVTTALNSGSFAAQAAQFDRWWVALCVVSPALAAGAALGWSRLSPSALRAIWCSQPAVLLGTLLIAYAAWHGDTAGPPFLIVSLLDSMVLCAVALVLRLRYVITLAVLLAAAPWLSAAIFLHTASPLAASWGFKHAANVMFVMLVLLVRHQLHQLSRARAVAETLRIEEERTRTESESFSEFARMVHDQVLSTFAAALRFDGEPPAALRGSADEALRALRRARVLHAEAEGTTDLTAEDAGQLIRDLIAAAAPDVRVRSVAGSGTIPAVAAGALGLAAAEAARNAVRHAGGGAGTAEIGDGSIEVRVVDEGRGFDPESTPADHFGVRESIVGRVDALAGGEVRIDSDGSGTTVVMRWTRPRE